MFDCLICLPVSVCFVEVGFPNVGKPFDKFIPEGLPAEVRLLLLGARSDWLIP